MGVEEFFDADLESDGINLEKLDRMAAKASVSLKKQTKALAAAQKQQEFGGGIFQGPNLPKVAGGPQDIQPLSKRDQQTQKKILKLEEKIRKDTVKQFGEKSALIEDLLGKDVAKNLFNIGRNPLGFIQGSLKALPVLGGVFAAKEIADFVIDELVKLDAFFKAFIDAIDERQSRIRDLEAQAQVQAGLAQLIITTSDGQVEARESYNTFEIFERNQGEIEARYELQNTSGVE